MCDVHPIPLLEHPQRCRVRCRSPAHPKEQEFFPFSESPSPAKPPSSGALGPVQGLVPHTCPWWSCGHDWLLPPSCHGCVCVCVCVCVPVWVSSPAAYISVNQTWDLKDGERPPKKDERHVLPSPWTSPCCRGTQISGQFLVNQN